MKLKVSAVFMMLCFCLFTEIGFSLRSGWAHGLGNSCVLLGEKTTFTCNLQVVKYLIKSVKLFWML